MITVVEIVVGLLIYMAIGEMAQEAGRKNRRGSKNTHGGTLSKLGATSLDVLTLTCFDADRGKNATTLVLVRRLSVKSCPGVDNGMR